MERLQGTSLPLPVAACEYEVLTIGSLRPVDGLDLTGESDLDIEVVDPSACLIELVSA